MSHSASARGIAAAFAAATVAAVVVPPPVAAAAADPHTSAYSLAAFTQPAPSTVLTLEGGLIGLIPGLQITKSQLRGDLCAAPNTCLPVNYSAIPLGQEFNDAGAVPLNAAIAELAGAGTPTVLYGHSQGGQVIYSALRGWAANPTTAPDPDRVSWVSIGNPENTFGGKSPNPIPADSPYRGTEVIRQYDGWADWPTDTGNTLAVLNAVVGMQTVHPDYFTVDVDDPDNLRYVEGNVTYVFVPTKTLPLVQLAGPLAPLLNPVLDPILRPKVESGYRRPVQVTSPAAAAVDAPTPAVERFEAATPVEKAVSPDPAAAASADPSPWQRVSAPEPAPKNAPLTRKPLRPKPAAAARGIASAVPVKSGESSSAPPAGLDPKPSPRRAHAARR